jgi:hypothetical protein
MAHGLNEAASANHACGQERVLCDTSLSRSAFCRRVQITNPPLQETNHGSAYYDDEDILDDDDQLMYVSPGPQFTMRVPPSIVVRDSKDSTLASNMPVVELEGPKDFRTFSGDIASNASVPMSDSPLRLQDQQSVQTAVIQELLPIVPTKDELPPVISDQVNPETPPIPMVHKNSHVANESESKTPSSQSQIRPRLRASAR